MENMAQSCTACIACVCSCALVCVCRLRRKKLYEIKWDKCRSIVCAANLQSNFLLAFFASFYPLSFFFPFYIPMRCPCVDKSVFSGIFILTKKKKRKQRERENAAKVHISLYNKLFSKLSPGNENPLTWSEALKCETEELRLYWKIHTQVIWVPAI